ncbi:GNAT family N-acetyltransferase [Arenibaculum sp.]|jgi:putative hemolysin|uniref:GNAT family N-acetyltransferase n=1 Tax=Arenibaculum sp. TaxID=2865862 RepID=UPI002E116939|nr:GNAT family N-acyltransferase [Arenibaculum sp.]
MALENLRRPTVAAAPGETQGLEVRLAASAAEIEAAQALRYRVFYEELGAGSPAGAAGRDVDAFDSVCDHLIILDHACRPGPAVVGTYRLLRRSVAERHGGFYTATEFDVAPLLSNPGELLELGRSCVAPTHRTRATMQLLWRGIAGYVLRHGVTLMFGCASLPGTDVEALAPALAYLHHNHLAPEPLRARALPGRYVAMDRLPAGLGSAEQAAAGFEPHAAAATLPPLLKGYLRVGGFVGDGAVVDTAFNTTDVCLIVPMDGVSRKYAAHFLHRGA